MLFGSLEFYIFFAAVFGLWLCATAPFRWLVLLGASYVFYYAWNPGFVVLLLFCSLASWWLALRIEHQQQCKIRRRYFALAVLANLCPLLFFKYYAFFTDSLNSVSLQAGFTPLFPHIDILLPIGISFFTLQAISYCADVYLGRMEAERRLGIFFLYLSFFPRLISGPIERGKHLLPQLREEKKFNGVLFWSGVQLFFWGLFKKLVLADRMGMYVDMVYARPADYWGQTIILAVLLYALQIYCDFSAYMNMAIGCGRVFGIELSRNFNFPYMARSIDDFWRRWHITLTAWFRDYVYIPLGGNRVAALRWATNIMIVFLVSGLWHGAAWTFVVWGGLHGFYYLFGRYTDPMRSRLRKQIGLRGVPLAVVQVIATFCLVAFAWIFFRAASLHDAWLIVTHMFANLSLAPRVLSSQFSTYLSWAAALLFVVMELVLYWKTLVVDRNFPVVPNFVKYPAYVAVLLATSLLGVSSTKFIYFHF